MPRKPKQTYNRTDRLDYIQTMLHHLRDMAQADRAHSAAFFIEMAYIEVSDVIRGATGSAVPHLRTDAEKRANA